MRFVERKLETDEVDLENKVLVQCRQYCREQDITLVAIDSHIV